MELLEVKERFIELRAKGWSFDTGCFHRYQVRGHHLKNPSVKKLKIIQKFRSFVDGGTTALV